MLRSQSDRVVVNEISTASSYTINKLVIFTVSAECPAHEGQDIYFHALKQLNSNRQIHARDSVLLLPLHKQTELLVLVKRQ